MTKKGKMYLGMLLCTFLVLAGVSYAVAPTKLDIYNSANADTIQSEQVDWGSGANQIDMDDIPGSVDYPKATSTEINLVPNQSCDSGASPTFDGSNFSNIPTNTSDVETIIDSYSYNSTEIYTTTEIDTAIGAVNAITPTAGTLEVTGVVSATSYEGDGSGLTGVAAPGDIALTKAATGTNTGYGGSASQPSNTYQCLAWGNGTVISANSGHSIVFGQSAQTGGESVDNSCGFGNNVTVSGDNCFALGYNSIAGNSSHNNSFAMGYEASSLANNGFALGQRAQQSGDYSFVFSLSSDTHAMSQANAMSIMGGNVGIGDLSPSYNLEVVGDIYASETIEATAFAGDGSALTGIAAGDFADGGEAGGADRSLGNTDNYDLGFITNNLTRLHITNGGNVGIGTTEAAEALSVVGSAIVSETLYLSSADAGTIDFGDGKASLSYDGDVLNLDTDLISSANVQCSQLQVQEDTVYVNNDGSSHITFTDTDYSEITLASIVLLSNLSNTEEVFAFTGDTEADIANTPILPLTHVYAANVSQKYGADKDWFVNGSNNIELTAAYTGEIRVRYSY